MGNVAPEIAPVRTGEAPAIAVETDRAALLAEAQAIAAEAEPENSAPPPAGDAVPGIEPPESAPAASAPPPDALAAEAAPALRALVATAAETFAPNWEITPAESDRVGNALALAMAYWMPVGAIEPKYLALLSLGGALYSVAGARRDARTGQFRPLRKPPAPAPKVEGNGAAAPAPGQGAPGALRL